MECKSGSPFLIFFTLLSIIYSQAFGLPALGTYSAMRLGNAVNFDGETDNDQTQGSLKASNGMLQTSLPENENFYVDLSRAMGRATRHADGLFTSGYSKLLGQLSARRYLESLIGKRVSNNMVEDQMPAKRHSDAIFTDNYSRFRKQMAVKKYLNSVLTGKRSLEEISPASLREDVDVSEPSFSENYDDATVDELLNHLPLTL
ncbi:VIP peptides isoform X1 [Protopterus annectens]|uniref:VIP peptides isoform X1 n=1 Tax=Protopterus annectens TaxID=7888 RepID=UPI001CF98959|nr:VIP peptides isoform X1 [Protopterus annectens]